MGEGHMFEAGWLQAELDAATREVDRWSPGMRRLSGVEVEQLDTPPRDQKEPSAHNKKD